MMKKILLCAIFLCIYLSSAFAGNMGYIWMPSRNLAYDVINYADPESQYILKTDLKKGLPDINSIIRIEAKNRMYFDFNLIQHITKEFTYMVKEGKCSDLHGSFSNFMLNRENKYQGCSIDSVLEEAKNIYRRDEPLYFILKYPIKAKVLGYVEFNAGVFVLVEQKELLRDEKKDN